jgi:peroxiredoxin
MKKNIILLLLLGFFVKSYTQEKYITKSFTTTSVVKINFKKIYDKSTGKRIKEKDFRKIIKNLKNYYLDPIIDKNGNVEKYLFDLNNINKKMSRDITQRVNSGDFFPDFNIKTLTNENISLKDLKGKIVILRFELFADNFRFKKHEIVDLDNQINQIENKNDKIKAIIIFPTSENEVIKGFDIENSNFNLVANGMNFHHRYLIKRYPTTIIIDEEGKLIDYFSYSNEIILKNLLNE